MNARDGHVLSNDQVEALLVKQTAPKVQPEDLEKEIAKEEYHLWPSTNLTSCVLTLKNGFSVSGESACADKANFNAEIGRSISRRNAKDKLWSLLGFRLRDKLQLLEEAGKPTGFIATHEDVKTYVGTKVVHAAPLSRGDYNKLRGWEVPVDENPEDEGYLVEYVDGGKPNHPSFTGYISWSPKDVFEKSYSTGVVLKETTFVERMEKELDSLGSNIQKLSAFITSSKFHEIDTRDQLDMRNQLTAMENYHWHLSARMRRHS